MTAEEEKLKKLLDRVFVTEEFDDPDRRPLIFSPMPDVDAYEELRRRSRAIARNSKNVINPVLLEPPLTKEQEDHLFRQVNCYKYVAIQELMNESLPEKVRLQQARYFWNQSIPSRNRLILSNIALIINVTNTYARYSDFEDGLSTALEALIVSVDRFDWRIGLDFSTYCGKAARNEIWASYKRGFNYFKRYGGDFESVKNNPVVHREYERRESLEFANRMIEGLDHRTRLIIWETFAEGRTLEDVGEELGITKERTRQIRSKAMQIIQRNLASANLLDVA